MDKKLCRILIADDNKDIHEDIKYILDSSSEDIDDYQETRLLKEELFGESSIPDKTETKIDVKYRVDDAFQGEEAVKMVQTALGTGDPYSLIFMDVRMPPGIDGIEAIEQIWEIDPNVEVVICTAYSDYSWDKIILKLGQKDNLLFIRKPFDNVALKQIALATTTKWNLKGQVREYIVNLEKQVSMRTTELTELVGQLKDEIALRKEKEKQLAYSAHYDSLTELLNRRSFYSSVSAITTSEPSYEDIQKFSLFYVDLDDFKSVNDIYGHDIGDKLLLKVAERIEGVLAEYACMVPDYVSDRGTVRAIFRLGGDEFTAIINEDNIEKVSIIAQKLIDAIKEPFFIDGHELISGCSIGISIFQQDNQQPDTLLKFSDIALYEAKKKRGTYAFYDQSESTSLFNELKMERDLKKAVEKDQIDVYFQRLVNTQEEIIGVQALVRWLHPEFGELKADQFIHIAEKSDQIITLGAVVLEKSLSYLKQMHKMGFEDFFVLINCTAREFYNPGFAETVKKALKETEVNPACLKLSLEDKFSFQATPGALAIIRELYEFGVRFALNGFESDYSTFVFLQQVPRDTIIRLNRDYVKNIVSDDKHRRFLLSLIDIIDTWDLNVIISGIETSEQKKLLDSRDCILQGYHFSVPKPFSQFVEDLKAGE